jgi:phosphatidylglycerophosphate synthase
MTEPTARKARPRSELLMQLAEPLARPLARLLARQGVDPLLIVALHSLLGMIAAGLIAWGGPPWFATAAVLLFLKTLLDNTDGAVARLSGKVTLAGRYFDTGMDFLVNALLFAALTVHMPAWLPLGAFLILTFLLSLDHNLERLYRLQRQSGTDLPQPAAGQPLILRAFRQLYALVLAPQDRFIERLEQGRFEKLGGRAGRPAPLDHRLAWWDMLSTASLVNLGLSTQLTLLGLALLAGKPVWYVGALYLMAVYASLIQLLRSVRFRNYLKRAGADAG